MKQIFWYFSETSYGIRVKFIKLDSLKKIDSFMDTLKGRHLIKIIELLLVFFLLIRLLIFMLSWTVKSAKTYRMYKI